MFWAMVSLGLGLVVLSRAIVLYQRLRLRFLKIFVAAISVFWLYLMPSFVLGYFEANDPTVLQGPFWRGVGRAYYLLTPVGLALTAFFLIGAFLVMQRENWDRKWLYVFWGITLVPVLLRALNVVGALPVQDRLRYGLLGYGRLLMILAFHGSLLVAAGRTQVARFSRLSQEQAQYLRRVGRALTLIIVISLADDLLKMFVLREGTGLLSILPVFLFFLACLVSLDRMVAVLFPRGVTVPGQEERFRSLVAQYGISGREQEIIRLVCQGKTNKEIEKALFISVPTVKDHISNIYRKTGASNRVQLAALFHFETDL